MTYLQTIRQEEAEQIRQGLSIKEMKGKNGKIFRFATTHLDPDPKMKSEAFEGDYPLMLKTPEGMRHEVNLSRQALMLI